MPNARMQVALTGISWEIPGLLPTGLLPAEQRARRHRRTDEPWESALDEEFPAARFVMFDEAAGKGRAMRLLIDVSRRAVLDDELSFAAEPVSGVYVAAGFHDGDPGWDLDRQTADGAAGRLAALLKFSGPAGAYHAMCSSTMLALGTALSDLRTGRVQRAVVVSGFVCGSAEGRLALLRSGIASANGTHRSFESARDGFLLGEGAVCLVLRSVSVDEIRQDRRALAILEGTANGFNAQRRAEGLVSVACLALSEARHSFRDMTFLEGHGSASDLDDVELEAAATLRGRFGGGPGMGSLRPVFGYSGEASGAFGILAMLGRFSGQWRPAWGDETTPVARVSDWSGMRMRHGLVWSMGLFGTCGALVMGWSDWMRPLSLPEIVSPKEASL